MEPARSTEGFSRRITVADANNIVAVLDLNQNNSEYQTFEEDYIVKFQVALEDLKVTVGLLSLSPAPYPEINALMSEAAKQAEIARLQTNSQKISLGLYTAKGNGPWKYESEVVLMSQGSETHVPILVPFLSTNETLLVGGDFKLGVKIEAKWNQPLKANDYLVIRGTYKQVVSFTSKKKDDSVDALAARIAALELALEGRLINLPANSLLGRDSSTVGTVQIIPRSTFKSADSDLIDGINSDRIVSGSNAAKANGGLNTSPKSVITRDGSGFFDCYGTQSDDTMPAGVGHMQGVSVRHSNLSGTWGIQIGGQYNLQELYFRGLTNGATNTWKRIWNDSNFAPLSHLQTFTSTHVGTALSINGVNGGIPQTYTFNYGFEVRGDSNNAAYFAFHRTGVAGGFFGLDTDNFLKFGGWTFPSKYRIWHEQFGIPVWQAPSDARLKKSIQPVKNALDMIKECVPVRFQYNAKVKTTGLFGSKMEREKYHYGFVAQDFPLGDLVYEKESGYLGIDYIEIIPFIVKSIQEISDQIDCIKAKSP